MTHSEEPRWELVPDTEFILCGTERMDLVGYLEFTDDVLCVCLHHGESSGASDSMSEDTVNGLELDLDLDDIPF